MNFLNFLTSKSSLFNFNLLAQSPNFQRENTILVQPLSKLEQNNEGQLKQNLLQEQETKEKQEVEKQNQIMAGKISQLLTNEQMLMNQYMELNLKYLANCLKMKQNQSQDNHQAQSTQQKTLEQVSGQKQDQGCLKKKIKKKNKCGHEDKVHYAKGMCNNCYHKYGRTKKPWNCSHDKLYAAGMCQNCYINNYNRKKRVEKEGDRDEHEKIDLESLQHHQIQQ